MLVDPEGDDHHLVLEAVQLPGECDVRLGRHHDRFGAVQDVLPRQAIDEAGVVRVLRDDQRRQRRPERVGDVGERVGMVQMDHIRTAPRRRQVGRREFLRPDWREGPGALHGRRDGAARAVIAERGDRNHLGLMATFGHAFRESLDHASHAAGARPVVLR